MLISLEQVIAQLERANLLQVEKATGVTRQTMYNILSGSDPRWSTLVRLTTYFDGLAERC